MPRRRRWTARRSWQWRSRPRWRTPRTTRTTMRRRTTRTTVRAVGGAPARGWLACAAALQWGSGAECREHRRRDAQQGLCACFGPGSQAVPNWAWLSGCVAWSLAPRPCRIKPGSQAVPQACNALCSHCIPVLRWNRDACCICGRAPGSEHCWVELPQDDSCRRLADEDDEEEGKLPGIKTHTFDGMDVRARPRARCGAPFTTPNADAAHAARSPRTAPAPGCHRATPGV